MRYAVPVLMVLLLPSFLFATFGTSFLGVVTVLPTGGVTLNTPNGIAVDTQGNVYIADTGNNQIVEVNALGTTSVLSFPGLSPALSLPTSVAIDGSGNIYVADAGNARVVELAAGVASVVGLGSATVSSPDGLAVDAAGDLYIADAALSRIVEVSGGVASVLSITGLSTALHSPAGLAVDPSGNLYIADAGNNRIVEVATGGAGTVLNITGGLTLSMPLGVAVDRVGNVYIADTSHSRIVTVAPGGTPTQLFTNTETLLHSAGVAVSVGGAIYIADSGNSQVVEAQPTAAGFGHVQLGASSGTTLALNLTVGFGVTLGSVQVLTQGTANLDFGAVSSGTTCTAGVTNAACIENITFLPTAPGLRRGSVVLFDNSSPPVPILSVPLYGFSDSPVAALAPNTGSVISTGGFATSNPFQLALDGAGNMYVADYTGKNVTKIPAGGGSASLVNLGTPGGTALQNITGVALDGAGNLFVGDHQNSRIVVMTPGGVVSVLNISGLSPSLGFPVTLVFDGAGNLYITDFTMGRVVEVSSLVVTGSTSSGQATVIGTGSFSFTGSSLTGATVDSEGTIYTAARTQNSSGIIKVTASGVASALSFPGVSPAINDPQGVSVDAMGNLYVVDTGNSRIVKLTTAGVASVLSISGLPSPSTLGSFLFGTTVDASGNLYICDWTNNRIVFVNVSGAVLSFASTNVGSTSSDSPKTSTVTNLGNQPLVFSANPSFTANFSQPTGSTNQCLLSTSLSSGTVCDVSVQFTPQSAGSLSAGIVATNNNLNVSSSTETIAVSGTGLATPDSTATAVSSNPTSVIVGQTIAVTATVTDTTSGHTATVPTGGVTFTDTVGSTSVSLNSGNPVTLSSGHATLTGVTLSGAGSHTITANYAGVSGSFLSSSNTTTVEVNAVRVTPTINWTLPTGGITYGSTLSSLLTASAANGSSSVSGTFSYTATPQGGTASAITGATVLNAGTYTITATFTPTDTTTYESATLSLTLIVAKASATVALASSDTTALAKSAVTFTATVASSAGTPTGTVSFMDGTTSLGSSSLAQGIATFTTSSLAAGAHTITAQYAGSSNFSALTSSAVTETVDDFSLNVATTSAASASVTPGGMATYALVIGPTTGTTFPAAVTLSVGGLPSGATATLTPKTLAAGAGATKVSLTVQVPSQTAGLLQRSIIALQLSPMMLGMLFLPFAGKIRRSAGKHGRLALLLLLSLCGISLIGLTGCGSKDSGFLGNPQTNYTLTVTATSGALSHSTTLTLTVQ
ncbi:MAG: Ig-like domain repeat protein [Candidatus Sulfotelmatobacter sp.]